MNIASAEEMKEAIESVTVNDFAHLHLHTQYSIADSMIKPEKLGKKLLSLGMDTVAVTDHGTMFNLAEVYDILRKDKIKMIFGLETYVAPRSNQDRESGIDDANYHLVLLAENDTGYYNLMQICSDANVNGMYRKPRTDKEHLKRWHEGIIALSACLGGSVQQMLMQYGIKRAKKEALELDRIFGRGNFFLELQDHGLTEQGPVNEGLIQISEETGIPLVVTNDCHYLEPSDYEAHDVLMAIQAKVPIYSTKRKAYGSDQFYVKSGKEMWKLFGHTEAGEEALRNTKRIADRCNVRLTFGVNRLPPFYVPEMYKHLSNEQFFEMLVWDNLKVLYGEPLSEEIKNRAKFEMEVIRQMGYINYFLITWDFFRFCRDGTENFGDSPREDWVPILTGPGRGSGAGSIVTYALGITRIDPLRYDLLFERFLDPSRISMPDIDSDFADNRRHEVIEYTRRKYGEQSVCQIVTFQNMMARAVVRDVGRALSMPNSFVDRIAKMIPKEIGMTLQKAVEINTQLKGLYEEDSNVRKLVDISLRLEGLPKSTGKHAAGVLITDEKGVSNYVPTAKDKEGNIISQFNMIYLERLGLLKMDFLGLKTLGIIGTAFDWIEKNHGIRCDINELYRIPDPKPFELMGSGQTMGIFQLEGASMTEFFSKLKPANLDDVTLGIAMYRPGPMQFLDTVLYNKSHPDQIRHPFKEMDNILSASYGVLAYQEQCMIIVRELAGFTKSDSDNFRRVISKKKLEYIPLLRQWFVDGRKKMDKDPEGRIVEYANEIPGGVALGFDRQKLNELFDQMQDFAKYCFNKSHAAAYATLSYVTAWLSYYYKTEFFAANLEYKFGVSGTMMRYIAAMKKRGISLTDIDINRSTDRFAPIGENLISYPLRCKNVKDTSIQAVLSVRPDRGFESLAQFFALTLGNIDKASFNAWACCGAFDMFGYTRSSLVAACEDLFTKAFSQSFKKKFVEERENAETPEAWKTLIEKMEKRIEKHIPTLEEYPYEVGLKLEKKYLGHYLTGHPMSAYAREIRESKSNRRVGGIYMELDNFEYSVDEDSGVVITKDTIIDGRKIRFIAILDEIVMLTTKKDNRLMARLHVSDLSGETDIIIWPDLYEEFRDILEEDEIYEFTGTIQASDDQAPGVILNAVTKISNTTNEKCVFEVGSKREANVVCRLLLDTKNAIGEGMPTYMQLGSVKLLLPEDYWVKSDVLRQIDRRSIKYKTYL